MTTRSRIAPLTAALAALGLLALLFGLWVGLSWVGDQRELRRLAEAATAGAPSADAKITRLNDWVYRNKGFAKNRSYFLVPKLEATPMQVVAGGGDCADKSRLLAAMAREVGIDSSLAMLNDCRSGTCVSTHVVTLLDGERGVTATDPVFGLTFPGDGGRLRTVQEIRRDPAVLETRLATLRVERGPTDKIHKYKRLSETYSDLTTVNWEKNGATRAVAAVIRAVGGDPTLTARPSMLEDPKQLLSFAGLVLALLFFALAALAQRLTRRSVVA